MNDSLRERERETREVEIRCERACDTICIASTLQYVILREFVCERESR